ncbi:MAG: hypothetical protein GX639_19470 [Fibrobacter sp.]|nr:hypothetical protein [Fibrobacter sp.]
MPISDAKKFLCEIIENDSLRGYLNRAESRVEIKAILKEVSYEFTYAELDEAYRNILVNCQTESQAELVKEVKKWWDLLMFVTPEHIHVHV